jgi:hypothetical protein
MKIMGNLIVVVPADPTLLEKGMGIVRQNFGINEKTETWDLRWRIVSVGDGTRYATDGGQVVHFPLQVQVGDIVVLRMSDASCRETWDREKFYWQGARAMRVVAASNPWDQPCGNILALVSRNGVEVNDSPEPRGELK